MARGGNSDIVDLAYDDIKIDDVRHRAVLFQFGTKEVWLPRSMIEIDIDAKTVALPLWKAELEGLDSSVV